MARNREVLAGQTISLRVRFRDDIGNETAASNVYVHIFDSNAANTTDLSNATVVSGVATDLGENIWSYDYTVPANGPSGIWYDRWEGDITYQGVNETFSFNVIASGIIEDLGTQLNKNNYVTVTLASGIKAADSTTLDSPYEFSFLTEITPAYTNLRKVHLEAGGFIANLPDDTVQLAILEASLETDTISFQQTVTTNVYLHARRQYTTCLAASILAHNLGVGLKSKTLADLRVEYDPNSLRDALNRFMECMARWEPQVIAGGVARSASRPAGVVKGEYDIDRPIVSRSWESTSGSITRQQPAANTRALPSGSRRYLRTWSRKPSFKKWW